MTKQRLFALLMAMLSLSANAQVTIKDDGGAEIRLEQAAVRPAAVSTFAADTLAALGVAPVAVTTFDEADRPLYLGEAVSEAISLGARGQPNLERLSAQAPDLILAVRRYTDGIAPRLEQIAPYVGFDDLTLADSLKEVADIGALVGRPGQAAALNRDFEQLLATMADQARGQEEKSIAMLVTASAEPFVYYQHFMPLELAGRLGLRNAAGESPGWPARLPFGFRMPLERLLAVDPDILVLFPSAQPRAFVKNPLWQYLKAVRQERVYLVGQHWKEGNGPIARELILRQLGHLAYPELFAAPQGVPAGLEVVPFQ